MVTRKRLMILLPVIIVIVSVAVAFALYLTKERPESAKIAEREWQVETTKMKLRTVRPKIKVFGTVVAGRTADLRALAPGRIVAVSPSLVEGGVVQTNQPLFELDPFEHQANEVEAKATLAEARSRLGQTRIDLQAEEELIQLDERQVQLREREVKRRQDLAARASASAKTVDDARLAHNEARQRTRTRKQTIERLRARIAQEEAIVTRAEVALKRAQRNLRNTVLRAPFSGFLVGVNLALGKYVATNETLARLIDADHLEVRVQFSEAEFARIGTTISSDPGMIGRMAEARWHIGEKEFRWQARIERQAPEIDRQSGGVIVFARLRGVAANTVLRPGAFIELLIPDREYTDIFILPDRAVGPEGQIYQIVDSRLREVKANILFRGGGLAYARAANLPEGAILITRRFPEIGPGLKVRIAPALKATN